MCYVPESPNFRRSQPRDFGVWLRSVVLVITADNFIDTSSGLAPLTIGPARPCATTRHFSPKRAACGLPAPENCSPPSIRIPEGHPGISGPLRSFAMTRPALRCSPT